MKLGYNTNGWNCHRWEDALEQIAEIGYRSVAITVDHHCLDPRSSSADRVRDVLRMREMLERLGLSSVIETGARFVLNPRVKHDPTLISEQATDRELRVEFLGYCVELAKELGSDGVSFWSGTASDDASEEVLFERLSDGCRRVCDLADQHGVRLAFEPEPGMLIDTMERFRQLRDRVNAPHFGLTIDVGHVQCVETQSIPECLREWQGLLFNIHIEDMVRGVHEHLRFGEGEIDFPPVLRTLGEIGYTGGVHVELSRHSHMAPAVARESFDFLSRASGVT